MRIFRISNILFLCAATLLGVLLFWTSQAVQKKENELTQVKNKLTQEEETVRVLGVEWDYLNRPQRLEELAAELGMAKASATEVVRNANDIPEPIVVGTDPQYFEPAISHMVSMETAKPAAVERRVIPMKKDGIVSPSTAEKQSFDKLIETLNNDAGGE